MADSWVRIRGDVGDHWTGMAAQLWAERRHGGVDRRRRHRLASAASIGGAEGGGRVTWRFTNSLKVMSGRSVAMRDYFQVLSAGKRGSFSFLFMARSRICWSVTRGPGKLADGGGGGDGGGVGAASLPPRCRPFFPYPLAPLPFLFSFSFLFSLQLPLSFALFFFPFLVWV